MLNLLLVNYCHQKGYLVTLILFGEMNLTGIRLIKQNGPLPIQVLTLLQKLKCTILINRKTFQFLMEFCI